MKIKTEHLIINEEACAPISPHLAEAITMLKNADLISLREGFFLDIDDPLALPALMAYAKAAMDKTSPDIELASDITALATRVSARINGH